MEWVSVYDKKDRIMIGNDCLIGANTLILGDCKIGNTR